MQYDWCEVQFNVRTEWPLQTEIVLSTDFDLPVDASHLRILFGTDNDIQLYINAVDITGGWVEHDGCALLDEYDLAVPDGVAQPGKNLLAVRAADDGVVSFVDLRILADQPLTGARNWDLYR